MDQEYQDRLLSKLDKEVTKCFLKTNIEKKDHFMNNSNNSFQVFYNNIKSIIEVNNYVIYKKSNQINKEIDEFSIKLSDLQPPTITYQEASRIPISYDEKIKINIIIRKKIINSIKTIIKTKIECDVNLNLPLFIGSNGVPILTLNSDQIDSNSVGGFFMMDNSVTRTLIYLEENTTPWLKTKSQKSSNQTFSTYFHSTPIPCVDEVKFQNPQYIKIKCNILGSNQCFNISSKNNIPNPINILILASYLTTFNLSTIKNYIMDLYSKRLDDNNIETYDDDVYDIINQLFLITYSKLNPNENECISIIEYITNNFKTIAKDDNDNDNDNIDEDSDDDLDQKINNLFPFINSIYYIMKEKDIIFNRNIMKGHLLISIIIQTINANFQKNIYPSNDNIANKRILSPGQIQEKILLDEIRKLVNDLSQSTEKNQNYGNKISKILRPKMFSIDMINKTSKTVSATKPTKAYSNLSLIQINNQLTKNLGSNDKQNRNLSRDSSLSFIVGDSATPDSQNVGQINGLSSHVIINNMTYKEQKKLIQQIIMFLYEHKYFIKIEKKDVFKDEVVCISLSLDNTIPIGYVTQNNVKKLYDDLIEAKRNLIFDTPFIDIALFPCYIKKIGFYEPIDKYITLKITIGHKVPFLPNYIVKDGIPNIFKYKPTDKIFNLPFNKIIQSDHDLFEYLGPEQLQTCQILSSINEFIKRPIKIRKLVQYIGLEDDLKLSILEAIHLDCTRSNGARNIFAYNQAKANISIPKGNNLESLETSKFTINNFQISPLTNPILKYNNYGNNQISMIVGVAHLSYNNNEDAITVTDVFSRYCSYVKILQYSLKDNFKINNNSDLIDNMNIDTYPDFNYNINGIIKKDSPVEPNIVLNKNPKTYYVAQLGTFKVINNSVYDYTKTGRVSDIISRSSEVIIMIHVRHNSAVGDKFSDLSAQKFTIGKIIPRKMAPYDINNKVPLIIFNSYSIEARRTENKRLVGMILNWAIHKGCQINLRSFANNTYYDYIETIKNDYKKMYPLSNEDQINNMVYCNKWLYNPETCERIRMKIPYILDFTSKLIQTSRDTVTSRGEIEKNFNNQYKGQKHGIMEMGCHIASGTTYIIQEIISGNLLSQTDYMICVNCMQPATYITMKNGLTYYDCTNCTANNFVPNIKKYPLNPETIKIFQSMPTFGVFIKIIEDNDFYIFKK